jgi:hypothetical protein
MNQSDHWQLSLTLSLSFSMHPNKVAFSPIIQCNNLFLYTANLAAKLISHLNLIEEILLDSDISALVPLEVSKDQEIAPGRLIATGVGHNSHIIPNLNQFIVTLPSVLMREEVDESDLAWR